jgi:hypothetical protein
MIFAEPVPTLPERGPSGRDLLHAGAQSQRLLRSLAEQVALALIAPAAGIPGRNVVISDLEGESPATVDFCGLTGAVTRPGRR